MLVGGTHFSLTTHDNASPRSNAALRRPVAAQSNQLPDPGNTEAQRAAPLHGTLRAGGGRQVRGRHCVVGEEEEQAREGRSQEKAKAEP